MLIGGSNVLTREESYPLFLTELGGETILERQVNKILKLDQQHTIYMVKKDLIKKYNFNFLVHELDPKANIFSIEGQTKGALCTALLATHYIDNDDELLLVGINDYIDVNYKTIIEQFRQNNDDAGVVYFNSIHPKYSFVKFNKGIDSDQLIPMEFSEKKPISKNALASFYYFKKGSEFVAAAKDVIRKDSPLNNNFYISMVFNEFILNQKTIGAFRINNLDFHSLKNEIELAQYVSEYRERKAFE